MNIIELCQHHVKWTFETIDEALIRKGVLPSACNYAHQEAVGYPVYCGSEKMCEWSYFYAHNKYCVKDLKEKLEDLK